MNEQLQRFLVGFGLAFCAGALVYVGEPVWSLLGCFCGLCRRLASMVRVQGEEMTPENNT